MNYAQLENKFRAAVQGARYSEDFDTPQRIWLALARVSSMNFNCNQNFALSVAENYLAGKADDYERIAALKSVSPLMDAKLASDEDSDAVAANNRIVCASLMRNDAMTPELAELVVEVCEDARIAPETLEFILRANIPEFGGV